jgi:nitroreductase
MSFLGCLIFPAVTSTSCFRQSSSENVYLFCASEGLATVVRGNIEKPALASVMKLGPDQKIILEQSVGYPPKTS